MLKPYRPLKTILISISSIFLIASPLKAQLIPDRTLGRESSTVVPASNTRDDIRGGARRGSNLFHSFQEFNVAPNREVYFNNPPGVRNIINRVTGRNISNIFGTLGVNGEANLYLINPNGIFFGDGAFLDIKGTFIGTTADGIFLGNNDFYSATNPENSSLLTVEPGAMFVDRIRNTPRVITNQSNLQINPGANITLSGDRIENNGSIAARSGNVFLEAVNGNVNTRDINTADGINGGGDINISSTGSITVDGKIDASGGDFEVNNSGEIEILPARTAASGNITLSAVENITFNNNSALFAIGNFGGSINIATNGGILGTDTTIASISTVNTIGKGRDINIRARSISLNNNSLLRSDTINIADTGNITINADLIRLENGSEISTRTEGQGNGGNLIIKANAIAASGEDPIDGSVSGIFALTLGEGDSGSLTINTDSLRAESGGQVGAVTFAGGNSGNFTLSARTIELIGASSNGDFPSGLFNVTLGEGDAGSLIINTNSLRLDGAQILVSTFGGGNSGNLTITARTIQLIGTSPDGNFPGGLLAQSESVATGDGGEIAINTDSLRVESGAQISANTFGQGKGGNLTIAAGEIELIGTDPVDDSPSGLFVQTEGEKDAGSLTINTDSLRVESGAQISASTFEQGKGGNLTITAGEIELIGTDPVDDSPSGLFFRARGVGDGGELTINTDSLRLESGAQISATTQGQGKGGNLTITAGEIELIGTNPVNDSPSGLFFRTQGVGDGGELTINTDSLRLESGAQISASTQGRGNGGNLTITAGKIELIGTNPFNGSASGLFSSAFDRFSDGSNTGNSGDISINTELLKIKDGATINSSNFPSLNLFPPGLGSTGNIEIKASEVILDRGTITVSGNIKGGGSITIDNDRFLLLKNRSQITADVGQTIDFPGGNLTINSPIIIANPTNNEITARAITSSGGNINIDTLAIFGYPQFLNIDASSSLGIDGNINIVGLTNEINQSTIQAQPTTLSQETPPQLDDCPLDLNNPTSTSSQQNPIPAIIGFCRTKKGTIMTY